MKDRQMYVGTVLNLYARTRDTVCPGRRTDRLLANYFFERRIPIDIVEAALLLGSARRMCHRGGCVLQAIRSLHYFEPIVEELAAQPPPRGYIDYLRLKVQSTAQRQAPVSSNRHT
jgi:hypothetical protein